MTGFSWAEAATIYVNPLQKETPKFTINDGIIEAEPIGWRDDEANFGKVLLTGMLENPKFVGQVDAETGRNDTFGDMADRTVKCAKWLLSHGVKSGDVVAICTANHVDAAIPVLASLCIGAIFNPWWDLGLTRDIAKHFVNLGKPKVVFASAEHVKIINDVANDVNVCLEIVAFGKSPGSTSFDDIVNEETNVDDFQCAELTSANEGAYVEYTSGSTGLPKGALHSHKSLFGNIAGMCGLGDGSHVVLCYSNLCWITGVLCTLMCVARFHTRIIAKTFTPENLCQLVEKHKITWVLLGTSLANRVLKSGELSRYDVSSLKFVWVGGAPLKDDAQSALRAALPDADVIQLYGITEIGGVALHQSRRPKPNSVGTLARSFQMKVIDPDTGRLLGPNETGEVCFKSPFMMTGYYNNPAETKKAFKSDGWFHTGDLAYYDDDGAVYIIDRLKELIKWRGHHVPPSVVEQIIQTYPGVTEAAVVGVPDWEDDERPIAFVTKSPAAKITEGDIVKLVEEHLPEQMWLRAGVQIVDQLPHTASGKIGRTDVKKMAAKFIRNS